MSKAVLISIRPSWCQLIANGKKTIEIRKTRPKLEPPFKCYIYCTANKKGLHDELEIPSVNGSVYIANGKVIGEFTCNIISEYEAEFHPGNDYDQDIREIFRDPDNPDDDCRDYSILTSNDEDNPNDCDFCKRTCLTFEEVKAYIGEECFCKTLYGWNISDLVIYDKPKDLTDFFVEGECYPPRCSKCKYFDKGNGYNVEDDCLLPHHLNDDGNDIKPLFKAPQSWCFVEEVSDNG